jgi:hypothetical protein
MAVRLNSCKHQSGMFRVAHLQVHVCPGGPVMALLKQLILGAKGGKLDENMISQVCGGEMARHIWREPRFSK